MPSISISSTMTRAVVSSVLVLTAAGLTSACGKTISIGDAKPAAPAPAASLPAAPASAPAAATSPADGSAAGGGALRIVGSTAAQDGNNGNGGTVTGLTIQEKPPVWVQLSAVTSPALTGPYLININQAALYRFDKDSNEPSRSHCNDACATTWPPVTIQEKGKVYLAGVDAKQVGAIRRDDGTVQLTMDGWPIYRFSGDTKPGDLKGQGVKGTWFAVSPTGKKVGSTK